MSTAKSAARMSLRLSSEHKKTIEDAAAAMGQTLSGFAISTLAHAAHRILCEQNETHLSEESGRAFLAMLDDESRKPNASLVKAARRYKKQVR